MYYLQLAVLCVTIVSVIGDLPPGTRRNTYLPPKPTPQGGYSYPTPPITFPTPPTYPRTPPKIPPTPFRTPPTSFPTPSTPFRTPPTPFRTRPTPSTGTTGYPGTRPPIRPVLDHDQSGLNGNIIGHDHHHHEPGMPFDFNYAVKEDAFGNDYSHNAISDGDIVRGEYRVQLPDGRTQVVRYTADWQHGFSAQVSYDGTPRFDVPRPGGNFNRGY